ncbi:uncharacterized protein ACLA_064140 [Aspergillus clavatus NRRL 1]|uniref:Cytochrome P450 n=1 Tax=Aspergillus clavatus (strain ATCC 1007 / CBS 513.65 / DSM 816 / NCTC 3887 / NRRL 1 / QM 1276 / 107) TaxID=344612 RepID=A1CD36_ASPCL|nr:uncharacterized protein ACLA_064140 [Aspergillus clavatus NRRL 1]EAW12443.1 hypothetical protein ACLA_064140 [Aspergillus clavatus NRRL 1]
MDMSSLVSHKVTLLGLFLPLLCGATFYLATNTAIFPKLASEIRGTFASDEEITVARASKCNYLAATIEECLRMYPPTCLRGDLVRSTSGSHSAIVAVRDPGQARPGLEYTLPLMEMLTNCLLW